MSINKPNDKRKQFYSIKDNLMRYYFTFIFGSGFASSSNKYELIKGKDLFSNG